MYMHQFTGVLIAQFIFSFLLAFIFPFLIRGGKPSPISVILSAFTFCTINGFIQSYYLAVMHVYTEMTWNVYVGVAVFFIGWGLNQYSDHILRNLRKVREYTCI